MRRESDASKDVEDGKEKSERKRQREKQRRSELTNAFDDLSAMVLKMDNGDEEGVNADGSARKKGRRMSSRSDGDDTGGGMTRVDLINRALGIMTRLHQENLELKQSLSQSNHDKGGEVMVMVPTLTPADDGAPPPPGIGMGSFRPPYNMPPAGFPPLPQQDHGQPPPHYQPRYPPPQQGGWYGPPSHFGPERSHSFPPPPPPQPQMDRHDGRQIR